MKAALRFLLLFVPVSLPLFFSFYYSGDRQAGWIGFTLVSLAGAMMLAVHLVRGSRFNRAVAMTILGGAGLFQLLRMVSFYFQGESFNSLFLFHFSLASLAAAPAYPGLLAGAIGYLAMLVAAGWIVMKLSPTGRIIRWQVPVMMLVLVALDPDLLKLGRELTFSAANPAPDSVADIDWDELALHPDAVNAPRPEVLPGKNLVMLYLESLEAVYLDEARFPGLTPNLNKLKNDSLYFSDMVQTVGTNWTMGGLVASQCGTPLVYASAVNGNDILQNGFLDDAVCLGDLLDIAGYDQVYLGGAPLTFAGKGLFLSAHGYDRVLGRDDLRPLLREEDYLSGWGLYDDSLLDIAAGYYRDLAAADRPFNLTLLTLDTHHPDGYASRSCPEYSAIDNSILDAVHCSDYLLGRFLDTIAAEDAFADTVVVIFSDHLAMRNVARQYYPDDDSRRLLFMIYNGGRTGEVAHQGSHMDVAPTVLANMGVRHNYRFLAGDDLTGDEQVPADRKLLSRERVESLRFLNSTLLTSTGENLCEEGRITLTGSAGLTVGNRPVQPTMAGQRINPARLADSHVQIVLLDPDGAMRSTMTVHRANLPHLLYRHFTEPMILIGQINALPAVYLDESMPAEYTGVLAGSPASGFALAGSAKAGETLEVSLGGCEPMFKKLNGPAAVSDKEDLFGQCRAGGGPDNEVENGSGNILLSSVAYQNGIYRAVLTPTPDGGYRLQTADMIGDIGQLAGGNGCHAYYGESELLIPVLQNHAGDRVVRMTSVPGGDWLFGAPE